MNEFINALLDPGFPFVRYALITGLLSSIPFGMIGSFVVVRRMSYIAGATSHASLGGIGIALFLDKALHITYISPLLGAFIFSLLVGLIISFTVLYSKERLDTIIGTIWALGMGIGLIFIHKTPGYIDPMSYLFGNIMYISPNDLVTIGVLNFIIIVVSLVFFNQLSAIAFDEELARVRGLNVAAYQMLQIVLISMTVILMVTIVGIVMVIAFLTIPPAVADLFTKRLRGMIIVSILLCTVLLTSGIIISFIIKLPSSSVSIVLAGMVYFLSIIIHKLKRVK